MSNIKQYIIYALIDPRTKLIRYIGKSSNGISRPLEHLCPSSLKQNTYKNNWIKSLLKLDLKPDIVILDISESNEENDKKEILYIKKYKELGVELTNYTEGGDGGIGISRRKPIIGLNIKTKEIKEYSSLHETAADGFSVTKVCAVCRGRKKYHKGWFFYYKDNPKNYEPPKVRLGHEVIVFNKITKETNRFYDAYEAAKFLNFSYKTVSYYCSNSIETKTAKYTYGSTNLSSKLCPFCKDNNGNCKCSVFLKLDDLFFEI